MKTLVFWVALMALLVPVAGAQETVITGFPLGVGETVGPEFFEPYHPQLQALADALAADPRARVILVGRADGTRYSSDHDAKNPGLSVGRAHALRNVLVFVFNVDSTQILIQSSDVPVRGDQYRSVSARIEKPAEPPAPVVAMAPLPEAEIPVPSESAPISVTENTNYFSDQMSLRLSGGVSSSPYGALPVVAGAVIWKRTVALEVVLGHTFWSDTYQFQGANLSTWQRMVSGRITAFPWHDKPVGLVAGWARIEEIAQSYYEYVKLSEGPVLGMVLTPFRHLSFTGLYNPARHRVEGYDISSAKNGQFLLGVSLFTDLGGVR